MEEKNNSTERPAEPNNRRVVVYDVLLIYD